MASSTCVAASCRDNHCVETAKVGACDDTSDTDAAVDGDGDSDIGIDGSGSEASVSTDASTNDVSDIEAGCETNDDCDDHDACDGVEVCGGDGKCHDGARPEVCPELDDPCRENVCDRDTGGCVPTAANDGDECDDGRTCTDDDHCAGGQCGGSALFCDDGIPCTEDDCSEAVGGCVHDDQECACASDSDCANDTRCDGDETCNAARVCVTGTVVVCVENDNPCQRNVCVAATGTCVPENLVNSLCNDEDRCTMDDRCSGGACHGTLKDCADSITCTDDACNPSTGVCEHDAGACECRTDVDCPDGDADPCNGGMRCNGQFACVSTPPLPDGVDCDDGLACTTGDACGDHVCVGEPVACTSSGDLCHPNVCTEAVGHCASTTADDGIACSDDDLCSVGDECHSGQCVPGENVDCEPISPCHDTTGCDPDSGTCGQVPKGFEAPCHLEGGQPGFCRSRGCQRRKVAFRFDHTCITIDGNVRCWGNNRYGQLGFAPDVPVGQTPPPIGDDEPASSAPLLDFADDVIDLTVGEETTCVLFVTGKVRCWGRNIFGSLGQTTAGHQFDALTAPDTTLANDIVAIESGGFWACALNDAGAMRCFGDNGVGQLGYPGQPFVADPGAMPPIAFGAGLIVKAMSVASTTCVIFDVTQVAQGSSNMRCWGLGETGALGTGGMTNVTNPASATNVPLGGLVIAIAAGEGTTCALMQNGDVRCWGANNFGQVGSGSFDPQTVSLPQATPVNIGERATIVSAGYMHMCAVGESGRVRCWGYGDALGLGRSDPLADPLGANLDTGVLVGGTVLQLAAGQLGTCAVMTTGALRCWGYGAMGYGTGTTYGDGVGSDMPSPDVPYE